MGRHASLPHLSAARLLGLSALAAGATLLVVVVAPLVGSTTIDLAHAVAGLRQGLEGNLDAQVFFLARLPRVLAAAACGAGLAAAGVAFQAVLRNPLATPYTLGVSGGGSLGAVLAIRAGLEVSLGAWAIPLCAFAGALAVVLAVYQLARAGQVVTPGTLLLAGVTFTFLCSALVMFVQYTADFAQSHRIVRWLMGGLDVLRYGLLLRQLPPLLVGLLLLLAAARDLNALSAGPDAAASLGVEVGSATLRIYVAASLVVGSVVAVAGPVGFVGLVVPHVVRGLVGPDHRLLLPLSIFAGAAFLVLCDTFARVVLAPAELPVGVVTALIGGPFFLLLLLRGRGRAAFFG